MNAPGNTIMTRTWMTTCLLTLPVMAMLALSSRAWGAPEVTTFASPEEAVRGLITAVETRDREALRALFGLATDELVSSDPVQVTNNLKEFQEAYQAKHRLVARSGSEQVLYVGANDWPFPIPLVKENNRWRYDTDAGLDELLARQIGQNELSALETIRAYVDAQREYAMRDRDGDKVLEYAQKFASAPGKKDGLYWPPELDGEISPLGPFAAAAAREGYRRHANQPTPYRGYYFKILTRQGRHAPGGGYRHIINGNMIGGFGLVAWPADYGESGIMTFIVNQQGIVYQKDLGDLTERTAPAMTDYNPDHTWKVSPD